MSTNKQSKTPVFANWLANQFVKESHLEEFFGDLQEIYQDRLSLQGHFHAKLMYWVDVLHLLIGFSAINALQNLHNPTIMFRHYITIAHRNLNRNKVSSLISIMGLAVGMGVCLLIYQYIHFEMSYDTFHANAQNIYRITQTESRNGDNLSASVFMPYALGAKGKEEIPEINQFIRMRPAAIGFVVANTEEDIVFQEDKICYVDSNYLDFFDFPLRYGDWETALVGKYNVVITQQTATRYFGDINPMGKALQVRSGAYSGDFIITGVLKELPINSHLQYDLLFPMTFVIESLNFYQDDDGWGDADFVTYVSLYENTDVAVVVEKFDHLITNYAEALAQANITINLGLQAITDIHFGSGSFIRDIASYKGKIQDNEVFAVIALFILVMAWVNYINLSTARAMQRAKEVGVRKSIGAMRMQLISQFIIESALINFIAVLLAIGIAWFTLPVLNDIIGKELTLDVMQNINFWGGLFMVIIFGSLLSGLYPAFVLSAFKPVSVFKSVKFTQGFSLRKGLIVFQFLSSVLLISGTYLVYQQITFMKHQDLGIDMDKILVLNGPRAVIQTYQEEGTTLATKYQTFKNLASRHHSISNISATYTIPGKGHFFNSELIRKLGTPLNSGKPGCFTIVDKDFADTYELEFLAVSESIREFPSLEHVIINEEALKVFELGSAEEALHENLIWEGAQDTLKIAGVVKNVHWNSLRDAHAPIVYFLDNEWGVYLSLKINLSDVQASIAHIEDAYHEVFPDDPFHYFFLDDSFNSQYQADMQFGKLFAVFALLAIFIACLGLFSLISYSTTLRIKEIGIRKVLGASVGKLMILLSKEYMILLLLANVLALPAVIYWGQSWLDHYAFRIGIGVGLLLIPGIMLVIISLLTVSYRTYAAAKANPVESLRSE